MALELIVGAVIRDSIGNITIQYNSTISDIIVSSYTNNSTNTILKNMPSKSYMAI